MKERINTNPEIIHFVCKKNRFFPNNNLQILLYKKVIDLPKHKNVASEIIQKIFNKNGWTNSWRNGIYDFHHYHSNTHECLGISKGNATVILGGPKGKKLKLHAGDVLILPAGVTHKCLTHDKDFLCVGSYPQGKDYDINTGTSAEYKKAVKKIKKLALPKRDPVLGKNGFLHAFWK